MREQRIHTFSKPTNNTNAARSAAPPASRAPSNGPLQSFRSGALQVTIWENESLTTEGQVSSYHSVTFDRRYKDKAGEWKSTNNLRTNDLPKAALLLNEAYKFLVLNNNNDHHE